MTVKGYFGEISAANDAIKSLEQAGFSDAFVDINDHYIGNKNVKTNLHGASTGASLSNLVLGSGSDGLNQGNSPLAAASPMVSGMGTFDDVASINYVVSVNSDGKTNEARKILKTHGGYLDDPNVSREQALSNAEVDLEKAVSKLNDNL
ncbi:hypothetical protein KQI41_00255 [Tissierella pigra]|uniref:hypothetical protein n=1 Tax=Tissierella pigra TaxID=2607614 RepID=UPI0018A6C053|nr:hypothetical protein [Tissierella pigra]MBU5424823.1 hypothetical protein [Tissierella pigra]